MASFAYQTVPPFNPCTLLSSGLCRIYSDIACSKTLCRPLKGTLGFGYLHSVLPPGRSPISSARDRSVCGSPMALSDNVFLHDLAMGAFTLGGALGTLKFWDELSKRNVFSMIVSRKLVHISVGLIFMLYWPLYSDSSWAPYIAAFSAAVNALRMLALGSGIMEDPVVVRSMTRSGDHRELLKGPFYYALTISLATTCFWRTSPVAPMTVANLCAGDGFADLIGRKFGKSKLPYNQNKSYIGSLAMLFFGFIFSVGYHHYFSMFGFYTLNLRLVLSTFFITLVTTFVESLPFSTRVDDNLTVPFTSFVLGSLLV